MSIYIAQLSRLSHCAPEATLKPIRFEFMPGTVVSNVLIAQVCWEAVPNTWPGGSKAAVTKCVVCAWNDTRSVGGRAELASRTLRPNVSRRPSMEVPCRTTTRRQSFLHQYAPTTQKTVFWIGCCMRRDASANTAIAQMSDIAQNVIF